MAPTRVHQGHEFGVHDCIRSFLPQVVETDYESYSCVHSCLAMMGFRAAFSWVLSRRPTLDPALLQRCHDRLNKWGVDTSALVPTTQGEVCVFGKLSLSSFSYG